MVVNDAENAIAEILPEVFADESQVFIGKDLPNMSETIPEGQRDHALTSKAGTMRRKGFRT